MSVNTLVESQGFVGPSIARRPKRSGGHEAAELRWILRFATALFVLTGGLAKVCGLRWRPWPPATAGDDSIVSGARAAAASYVPYAFTGL